VVVGGTGLYVRALMDDFKLDEANDTAHKQLLDERRAALTAQASTLGADAFHALLAARDPQSAALIHPHNVRRVIRAFEFLDAGSSYAQQHEGFARYKAYYPGCYIGLEMPRPALYACIDRRVDKMFADGLLDEVRALTTAGFSDAITAMQAIGYKEVLPVLRGESSKQEAAEAIKQATRHYAKRQATWFKRDKRIKWFAADSVTLLDDVIAYFVNEH
jgi:tRNA dimethylallyltransferase